MPRTIAKPSTATSRRFSMDTLFIVLMLVLIIVLLGLIEFLEWLERK